MKYAQPRPRRSSTSRTPVRPTRRLGLGDLFKRELDRDLVVVGDGWLKDSGVQRQLEFEGFQLRWVGTNKLDVNLADGWEYVTVSHYLWWYRRVRRRQGSQTQYLLKRVRSFRGLGA